MRRASAFQGPFLACRGFTVTSVEFRTPDGRTWQVHAAPCGGYRLFEIGIGLKREEHDAVEGDAWDAGDLLDYLQAVGTPRRT